MASGNPGKTVIDLTADTVTASTLTKGVTAHNAAGASITGTLTVPTQQTKTVNLSMASGNQTIKPDSGKVLSQVTITKPSTLIAENIKKDVDIGGVIGTMESGSSTAKAQEKTVQSSFSNQTITPDDGYDYLSKVTVTKITKYVEQTSSGLTLIIGGE